MSSIVLCNLVMKMSIRVETARTFFLVCERPGETTILEMQKTGNNYLVYYFIQLKCFLPFINQILTPIMLANTKKQTRPESLMNDRMDLHFLCS